LIKRRQRFLKLDDDLKKQALKQLGKTLKRDKDKQIVLIPHFFRVSLGQNGKGVLNDLVVQLGLANLYGWMAYTIYDDFLDKQGDPKLLSVANLCLRESTIIFNTALPQKSKFQSFLQWIADAVDAANTWEVTHCRAKIRNPKFEIRNFTIPEYGDLSQLAEKSFGHALGPAAILFSLGYSNKSPEIKNLMKFFKHYLIARQLNDDAHDWERDLKMGHVNAVGAEILKKAKSQKSPASPSEAGRAKVKTTTKKSKLDNTQLLPEIFWYEIVVNVCDEVLRHVQKARGYIKKVSVVTDTAIFEKILSKIEQSAAQALKEREETLKFLKAYQE